MSKPVSIIKDKNSVNLKEYNVQVYTTDTLFGFITQADTCKYYRIITDYLFYDLVTELTSRGFKAKENLWIFPSAILNITAIKSKQHLREESQQRTGYKER